MCGICGVVDWSDAPDSDALVRRMTPTMRHRGPDDEGYLESKAGRLSMGMRRLSIIDVEGGHQPIFNEEGTVGAVLNGEIYNFRELRDQLAALGHAFHTRSDSEVVAHAYEEWGAECVERLQGMFAFAVYDRRGDRSSRQEQSTGEEGVLFLARDRLGIKPLYYAEIRGQRSEVGGQQSVVSNQRSAVSRFIFASEVRTVLASGVVARRLSPAALESYLLFGSVCEPMTLVEGVLSLPPGHTMMIPLGTIALGERQEIEPKPYWNIGKRIFQITSGRQASDDPGHRRNVSSNGHAKADATSIAGRVRTLLEESVRSHLVSDVPVGVFLSGGIDSTSLAALASREVSDIHTFTVAFAEKEFSEADIARRTAATLGTTHKEVVLSGDEMLAGLSEAVGSLDQPSMDGINTYFVSMSARQAGLKVTLSGLGGDEVFGGYSTFRRTPKYQRLADAGAHVPAALRSAVATVMSGAMSAATGGGNRFVAGDATRKLSALWNTPGDLPDPFYFGRTLFTPAQVSGLLTREQPVAPPLWWNWLAASAEQARELDPFAAVSCMEMQSYMVNTLLRDTDSMSMAHSLEVRVPFLDHSLVEFVSSLPQEMKLRKGVPKALLVTALEDLLPSEVVNQTKRGFTFPWSEWLRGPLKNQIANGLSELSPALAEAMNAEHVRGIWQNYLDGNTSWSRPWSLYVLNEWVKKHLD